MKKICLIFSAFLMLFSACKREAPCEESAKPTCCAESTATKYAKKAAGTLSDLSVYYLSSEWTSQDGEQIKLGSFQGKPQLVALIYTSCSYACPRIVSDLKRIEEALNKDHKEGYGIILVTMDPENDTPEKLKNFSEENNLDLEKWKLLTANPEDIRELSIMLNVKYKQSGENEISHSNIISVLNRGGEIVYQEEGLGVGPEGTVKAMTDLLGVDDPK